MYLFSRLDISVKRFIHHHLEVRIVLLNFNQRERERENFQSTTSMILLFDSNRTVAVSAMDIEFERIDINPCPISDGNPEPNYFAGTARCKPSTMVSSVCDITRAIT